MSWPQQKLTPEQHAEIRSSYRSGVSQSELARKYGVQPSAINWILSQSMDRPIDQRHCPTCTCYMRGA